MHLLVLVILQCAVILWLHHGALHSNLLRIRRFLANHPEAHGTQGDAWVEAGQHGRYSFWLCPTCVDAIVLGPNHA
jgi:hypothetical protein